MTTKHIIFGAFHSGHIIEEFVFFLPAVKSLTITYLRSMKYIYLKLYVIMNADNFF